jgi:Glycosyl-hydrolase 97 C-terminal, oligomerisation
VRELGSIDSLTAVPDLPPTKRPAAFRCRFCPHKISPPRRLSSHSFALAICAPAQATVNEQRQFLPAAGQTQAQKRLEFASRNALDLPLSFLEPGRYTVKVWKDAPDADSQPNHLTTETLALSSAASLQVHLALDGGFVAQLTPSPSTSAIFGPD